MPMKHRGNQDPVVLDGIEDKIRKSSQERLPGLQGDHFVPLRLASQALDCRVEGEREFETEPRPLRLIPAECLLQLPFCSREDMNEAAHREDSSRRLISSHNE